MTNNASNNPDLTADGELMIGNAGSRPSANTLTAPVAGIDINNTGGNITFALADNLAGLEDLSTTGMVTRIAMDSFTTRSIAGTTARILVTNAIGVAGNPTIDIASTYIGQTSIIILGTVQTGVWNGTLIGVDDGGTGASGITGIVAGSGAATPYVGRQIQGTANEIDVVDGDGVSGNPTIDISATYVGQTSITTLGTVETGTWSGDTIAIANGGTGSTGITGLIAGNGTAYFGRTIQGTANEITVTNGNGAGTDPVVSLPSTIQVSGISFDGGTNSLTDYEEGTWTPGLDSGTSPDTIGFAIQAGQYTRIGNLVYVTAYIVVNAFTLGSGAGVLRITGIPFTSGSFGSARYTGSVSVDNLNYDASADWINPIITPSQVIMTLAESEVGVAGGGVLIDDVTATTEINVTISYEV